MWDWDILQKIKETELSAKNWFLLAYRLAGIYCFVIFLSQLASGVYAIVGYSELNPDFVEYLFLDRMFSICLPLIYLCCSLYLIAGGEYLFRFSYDDRFVTDKQQRIFYISLKIMGLFLVVSFFPDLFKAISAFVVYKAVPGYVNMMTEKRFFCAKFFPSLGSCVFGLYLMKNGKFFVRFAFKRQGT